MNTMLFDISRIQVQCLGLSISAASKSVQVEDWGGTKYRVTREGGAITDRERLNPDRDKPSGTQKNLKKVLSQTGSGIRQIQQTVGDGLAALEKASQEIKDQVAASLTTNQDAKKLLGQATDNLNDDGKAVVELAQANWKTGLFQDAIDGINRKITELKLAVAEGAKQLQGESTGNSDEDYGTIVTLVGVLSILGGLIFLGVGIGAILTGGAIAGIGGGIAAVIGGGVQFVGWLSAIYGAVAGVGLGAANVKAGLDFLKDVESFQKKVDAAVNEQKSTAVAE